MTNNNLSANGSVTFPLPAGAEAGLVLGGDFGGGTVAVTYEIGGSDVEYPDSGFTEAGGAVYLGCGAPLKVTLSGATSPDLDIRYLGN
jgi:hypothetical protein